ncbi:MAG: energy-coupling factor ABC transporter ATP-binding protein [Anaerolineales bacterium]
MSALRKVELLIHSGETVALVGSNGAGKTTLAKHLNGLLRPSAGRVWVGDWNTADHTVAQLARRVAYAFQNPADQLFERTVRGEVAFGPRRAGLSKPEQDRRVAEALELTGLEAEAERHPYDLNPSDRKLVSLAAAVAMRTPVCVLDEPTTGQDSRGMASVDRIINSLKQSGQTLILISHDMDFCADHADRVVVMVGGQIAADGPAGQIFAESALLHGAGLEAPQLVRLAQRLGILAVPLGVEDFLEVLAEREGRRS